MSPTALLAELETACPMRAGTNKDAVDDVPAAVVARPGTTEQTSELLRRVHRLGGSAVATGHRSKLTWGRPPARVDVLIETGDMNRLVEHQPGDLIATAEAGLSLTELNQRLHDSGQELVIDDPVGDATIGGMLATGLCGARRLWVGAPRDLLLGLTFVRADGTIAHSGGKVVKNVAGYDLGKLLTGSYGTLGLITQATFRLHPVPAASQWTTTTIPGSALPQTLSMLLHTQLAPRAIELDADQTDQIRCAVLFGGTHQGVAARVCALTTMLSDQGLDAVALIDSADSSWLNRLPGEPGDVLFKLTTRLSGIPDLIPECTRRRVRIRGSAGVGVFTAAMSADADAPGTVATLRRLCTELGGSLVVLDAPAQVKNDTDVWGDDAVPGLEVMRRVKNEFDPAGVLSPGRFVGGI
ncbi:MAG: hypothetical protein CSA58_00245 [Micrococcales bacterium]|nr:MAG: hypothetical protein CSB46_06295 [Micrococcales bacterium]PIE25797.1 MAG: hypothetical protein CSA58_12905 [Micrococcales bacterium]PIE28207.1 MAG: hypothetical protein CSA58_00245 [Micrococcales bacterium]